MNTFRLPIEPSEVDKQNKNQLLEKEKLFNLKVNSFNSYMPKAINLFEKSNDEDIIFLDEFEFKHDLKKNSENFSSKKKKLSKKPNYAERIELEYKRKLQKMIIKEIKSNNFDKANKIDKLLHRSTLENQTKMIEKNLDKNLESNVSSSNLFQKKTNNKTNFSGLFNCEKCERGFHTKKGLSIHQSIHKKKNK